MKNNQDRVRDVRGTARPAVNAFRLAGRAGPLSAKRARDRRQALYNTPRWRAVRKAQLTTQPLCERCEARGHVTVATVCHHVTPHKGDEALFWAGPFASLCKECHDIDEQGIEARGYSKEIGADGWPIDPAHPANANPGRGIVAASTDQLENRCPSNKMLEPAPDHPHQVSR